ncbi:hypothetical protein GWK47_025056 [Chionoecetes opilio]|uniref:Uncharacterized protein n=1 Tax=Chionoecetes opilio TaxID=41210 RepID=A0A8J5CDB0_CHIOP|nr:hypothetical protein GWK47_025056 [Chionoecetes opilio]
MCLPGRAVLRRLTSALSVQSGLEVKLGREILHAHSLHDDQLMQAGMRTCIDDPIESISADRQVDIFLQPKVNTAFQAKLGVTPDKPWFANPFVENQEQHEARVHVINDTVHLWKNGFYQLLNKKKLSQEDIHVDIGPTLCPFTTVNLGQGGKKWPYRLTEKGLLNPTNIERTNVLLVAAATHESTTTALVYYADKCSRPTFKETAAFLCLLRKWFNTCNVKSRGLYNWHNEPTRKPVPKHR